MSKQKNRKANTTRRTLTMRSSVKTLSMKFYDEQLPKGWETVKEIIKAFPKEYHVIAIRHDKDYNQDDIWGPSAEKPHYHIIWRTTCKTPSHVSTILNQFGVKYRPGLDDTLWEKHGVETVGDFGAMATYLTHDTEQAMLDGKAHYELSELVSNLSLEEIKQARDGYIRVSTSSNKVDMKEWVKLDEKAFQLGYELKDYQEWQMKLSFPVRSNSKVNALEKSYHNGVLKRVGENESLNRLCIFVQGPKNVGKTYASVEALKGLKILKIGGGGSGKFDKLSPSTNAIVVDDDKCPNLLNMSDNYMCQAYRRGSNNQYWCGQYFIVTSNLTFKEWLEESGIQTSKYVGRTTIPSEQYRAMQSRFYICHIENKGGVNTLICDSVSDRGTFEDQTERKAKYIEFRDKYNESLRSYVPDLIKVDYSDINGACA